MNDSLFEKLGFPKCRKITQSEYNRINLNKVNGLFLIDGYLDIGDMTLGSGTIAFLKNGIIHNEAGPAIVKKSMWGDYLEIKYFKDGIMHRDSAPYRVVYDQSVIWNGDNFCKAPRSKIIEEEYMKNGKLHRLDGPALWRDWQPTENSFYVNGISYSEKKFYELAEVKEFQSKLNLKNKMNKVFKNCKKLEDQ